MGILVNEISTNETKPSDKDAFLETLRALLDSYPTAEFYNKPNNPIPSLIQILGMYRDNYVVKRLKYDAENCSPQILLAIGSWYSNHFTAKIIENNRIDLVKFGVKLQKLKKREAIDFIENMRRNAASTLRDWERSDRIPWYLR